MKHFLTLFVSMMFVSKIGATEYKSEIVCKDNFCQKKEIFTGVSGPELKVEDLKVGQCVYDEGLKKFSRVSEQDISAKKVVFITEIEDQPVTVMLKRDTVYTDSRSFNTKLRLIPCSQVDGIIINDEQRFSKCLNDNGKHSMKLFCDKPRKTSF